MEAELKTITRLYIKEAQREDLTKIEEFLDGAFGGYTKKIDEEKYFKPVVIYTFNSELNKFHVVDELMNMIEIHYNKHCFATLGD